MSNCNTCNEEIVDVGLIAPKLVCGCNSVNGKSGRTRQQANDELKQYTKVQIMSCLLDLLTKNKVSAIPVLKYEHTDELDLATANKLLNILDQYVTGRDLFRASKDAKIAAQGCFVSHGCIC